MYRRIMVPLDGSEQAERALALAARIGRSAGGAVTLMQVVSAGAARGSDAVPVHAGGRVSGGDRRSAAEYLQRMRQHPALVDVPTTVVVRAGSPAEQIVAEAERRGADLIVISHRHHGPAAPLVFGSVADDLMRQAHVPVLVLHSDAAAELVGVSAARPVQALVPLDGSPFAERAIPRAIELLRALETGQGAALHLTYVLDPKHAYRYDTPETEAMHRARTYLEKTARDVKADPLNRAVAVSWAIETDAEVVTG
ncbi:MAG: universal stress protein, partial [Ktedonobacterales bacterium]